MNKKGQTLIIFVILIPIFLLLFAFGVDTGIVLKEKTRLNSTTRTILKNTYSKRNQDHYNELVMELLKKNEIPVDNLEIEKNSNQISISNSYEKESVFGKIIGLKTYKIKSTITLKIVDNEIKIEKE